MRNNLRRTLVGPKNYLEPDEEDLPQQIAEDKKDRQLKQVIRQSIFENRNWLLKEKVKLVVFFNYYISLPDWYSERKSIHMYKHLSNFLKKSRTPEQCKNIHSLLKHVVEAIRQQLEDEENYEKLLNKYEKEIEIYELENKLKDERLEVQAYQSLRSRKVTEGEAKGSKSPENYQIRQVFSQNKPQNSHRQATDSNKEVQNESKASFQRQRQILSKKCDFFFKQWTRLTLVLQHRKSKAKTE